MPLRPQTVYSAPLSRHARGVASPAFAGGVGRAGVRGEDRVPEMFSGRSAARFLAEYAHREERRAVAGDGGGSGP